MLNNARLKENGAIKNVIFIVIGVILFIGVSVFAVWSFVNYMDQKTDVDGKISAAVDSAKKVQADLDEAKRLASEKLPYLVFYGPDDYGRVTFNYPKTWSTYIKNDASGGGAYEAYFNPVSVPPIVSGQLFALHVVIQTEDYDKAVSSFNKLVQSGSLNSSPITVDGSNGTRFDGNFSKNLRGSLVIFKIRDKTLVVRTDATTFTADFDTIVASIKFNQ